MKFLILILSLLLFCSSRDSIVSESVKRFSKVELNTENIKSSNSSLNREYLIEQLKDGFLARCDIPKEMKQGKKYKIELRIDENKSLELIENIGENPILSNIKICENMVADLNGSSFKIISKDSTRQTLNPFTPTVWRWDVIPLNYGNSELEINVYCLVIDEYGNRDIPPVKIHTYTEKLNIKINIKNVFSDLFKKYWLTIISFVASGGFIGYIIKWWKRNKKNKEKKRIRDFLNNK
jgi:hypothetical protein